jgi:hypothetical protein
MEFYEHDLRKGVPYSRNNYLAASGWARMTFGSLNNL